MAEKKSFLVYTDWEEALSYFSDAETGEIFRALFQYAKNGTMPEFSHNSLNAVFSFMKSALDRDLLAYEERCRKNKENGSKGGRPKKPNGFEENPKKPNGYFEKPKKPDNDNVIDNVIDIDNGNENGIDNVSDSVCIYGEFDNVFLSEEEYTHLQTQFPDSYNDIINKFSRGLKTYGYKYDCHYTAILQWVENDKKQEQPKNNTTSGNPFLNAAKETIFF